MAVLVLGMVIISAAPAGAIIAFDLTCTLTSDTCRDCPGDPGSANGEPDPAERLVFDWTLENIGDEDATSVRALVDSLASDIFCQPDLVDFGDLPSGQANGPLPSPTCTLEEGIPCGSTQNLVLQIATDQGGFSASCSIQLPTFCDTCCGTGFPVLESCSLLADACGTGGPGSGDGVVDPGETIQIGVTVSNQGNMRTDPVRALLATSTPGARVLSAETTYGSIAYPDSEVGVPPVELFVDEFVAPDTLVTFEVEVQEDVPSQGWRTVGQDTCSLSVGDPVNVCAPAAPPGEVPHLEVERIDDALRFTWQPAPEATRHAIHAGDLDFPPADPWSHAPVLPLCLVPYPWEASLPGAVGDGTNRYYLAEGRNGLGAGGTGSADLDGDGVAETPRPADLSACP